MISFDLLTRSDRTRIVAWLRARGWRQVISSPFASPFFQNEKFSGGELVEPETAVFFQVAHERVLEHPAAEEPESIR